MYTILLVVHSILVVFLIGMVLIQRTDSDGLGGLGGGGNQFMTGRAAANLMTRTTSFLAAGFMLTSLVLAIMASHQNKHSIIDAIPAAQTAPADTAKETTPSAATKEQAPEPVKKKQKTETPSVPKPE